MKFKTLGLAACLALVSAGTDSVQAQQPASEDFRQLLAGSGRPLTLTFRELTPAYRRFEMQQPGDTFTNLLLERPGLQGMPGFEYYTTGETVSIGRETYLVAYRPQVRRGLFNQGPGDAAVPLKHPPHARLHLSLLNLRTAGSLADVRPFDPKRDIQTVSEGAAASLCTLVVLGRGLQTALQMREGVVPKVGRVVDAEMRRTFYPFVHDERAWRNPMTDEFYKPNPSISGLNTRRVLNSRFVPAFYEADAAGDGTRGVAFLDGHAERISAHRWERIRVVKPILKPPLKRTSAAATVARVRSVLASSPALRGAVYSFGAVPQTNLLRLDVQAATQAQLHLAARLAIKVAGGYQLISFDKPRRRADGRYRGSVILNVASGPAVAGSAVTVVERAAIAVRSPGGGR